MNVTKKEINVELKIYIIKIIEICINQRNDYYTFIELEYVPTPPHSKSSNNKQSLLNTFTSISLLKEKKKSKYHFLYNKLHIKCFSKKKKVMYKTFEF